MYFNKHKQWYHVTLDKNLGKSKLLYIYLSALILFHNRAVSSRTQTPWLLRKLTETGSLSCVIHIVLIVFTLYIKIRFPHNFFNSTFVFGHVHCESLGFAFCTLNLNSFSLTLCLQNSSLDILVQSKHN